MDLPFNGSEGSRGVFGGDSITLGSASLGPNVS